jgi:sirohydrochlorin cobaltochelatase
LLVAHGARDPAWRAPIEAIARRLRALAPGIWVQCAYLEHSVPDLPAAVAQAAAASVKTLRVCPLFLGAGRHARQDLPRLLRQLQNTWPAMVFDLQAPVFEQPQVIDALATAALAPAFPKK